MFTVRGNWFWGGTVIRAWLFAATFFFLIPNNSLQAADWEPSTTYLILVNGYEKPKNATKYTFSATFKQLKEGSPNTQLSRNLLDEIAKRNLTESPFAVEFSTNARSAIVSASIYVGRQAFAISADAPKTESVEPTVPPSVPTPMPRARPRVARADEERPSVVAPEVAVRNLVVVNRRATEEENKSGKYVQVAGMKDLAAASFKDAPRQALHQMVLQRISEQHLEDQVFTIEWAEDANHGVVGDVAIITANDVILVRNRTSLRDPEEELSVAAIPSVKEVLAQSKEEGGGSNSPLLAMRWAISADRAELGCTLNGNGAFNFRNPEVQEALTAAGIISSDSLRRIGEGSLAELVSLLPRAERWKAFEAKVYAEANPRDCLSSFYTQVWTELMRSRKEFVLWDFKNVVGQLSENRSALTFIGEEHIHRVDPNRPEVALWQQFTAEILTQVKPSEFAYHLPRDVRDRMAYDTNTPDVQSRMEPIDILTYYLSAKRYPQWLQNTDLDTAMRNTVVRAAIQHSLVPESYTPHIFLAKQHEGQPEQYTVFCAGGAIQGIQTATDDPLVSSVSLSGAQLRGMRGQQRGLSFNCGTVRAALTVPVQVLKVPLKDPIDERFVVGEDNVIKGVSTFPIVSSSTVQFVQAMKAGTALQGYLPVTETAVRDLRADFLAEMKDSDFFFPMYSHPEASRVLLGFQGGSKLHMRRAAKGRGPQIDLILYLPRQEESRQKEAVYVSDTDMAELFRSRRKQEVQRRLCVLNIVCGSEKNVPVYMRYYSMSLDGGGELTPAQVDALNQDVPVVWGAGRSFNGDNLSEWLTYAQYPFTAMDLASRGERISDVTRYLDGQKFNPKTSSGQQHYFDVKLHEDKLFVEISTSAGERVSK